MIQCNVIKVKLSSLVWEMKDLLIWANHFQGWCYMMGDELPSDLSFETTLIRNYVSLYNFPFCLARSMWWLYKKMQPFLSSAIDMIAKWMLQCIAFYQYNYFLSLWTETNIVFTFRKVSNEQSMTWYPESSRVFWAGMSIILI